MRVSSLSAHEGKCGAVELWDRVDSQVFECVYFPMASLATTSFVNTVIFPSVYITLAFNILNIYFAFLAFKEMLLFLSFQKKEQIWELRHLVPQCKCSHEPLYWPKKSAVRLDDLPTRQKPDQHDDFGRRGLWENRAWWQPSGTVLPPHARRSYFRSQEGVLDSLVSGRFSTLTPKAWLTPCRQCSPASVLCPPLHKLEKAALLHRASPLALLWFLSPGSSNLYFVDLVVPTVFHQFP